MATVRSCPLLKGTLDLTCVAILTNGCCAELLCFLVDSIVGVWSNIDQWMLCGAALFLSGQHC